MGSNSDYVFVGSGPEGQALAINGVDVWKHKWIYVKENVEVNDPLYQQKFTFHIYEICDGNKTVRFAAGEFSNGMFGFYAKC